MLRRSSLALFAALTFLTLGCNETTVPAFVDPATISYAPELNVDLASMTKTSSGLYYKDLTVGTGATAQAQKTVSVHYTGWLPDAYKFDSSRDRGEAFSFKLGVGQVIAGWDEGVANMRVGGRRQLVIPPQLGYGHRDMGVIPPNSVLVFDVELLGVTN